MSAPVWTWDDIIADLKRDDLTNENGQQIPAPDAFKRSILDSEALRRACYTEQQVSVADIVERISNITFLLATIKLILDSGHPEDLRAAANELDRQATIKANLLEKLRLFEQQLSDHLAEGIRANIKDIEAHAFVSDATLYSGASLLADFFDVSTIGKRGGAHDDEAAFRAWCVKQLNDLVSPDAIKRYATIRSLLAMAGLNVSKTYPRTTLMKGG